MLHTSVHVRMAKQDDSKSIWSIRYNEKNIPYFRTKEKATFEDSNAWYVKKYFGSQKNYCFVGETTESIIGYCRYDYDEDKKNYFVSIALDPGVFRKGFGGVLLSESIKQLPPEIQLSAEIKKENIASKKLFEKTGFTVDREDEEYLYLSYERS